MIRGSIAYSRWVASKNTDSLDLTIRKQNVGLSNALLIPGLQTPLNEIRSLLFAQGQPGVAFLPSLAPTMISGNTLGSGFGTFVDLSGRGNNATQGTAGFQPAWGRVPKTGRRNLLLQTSQFDLSPWTGFVTGTGIAPVVTPNAAVAPDGSMTADLIAFDRGAGNTSSDQSVRGQIGISVVSGQHIGTIWLKAATAGDVGKQICIRHVGAAGYGVITLTADWVRYSRIETGAGASFEFGTRGAFTVDNVVAVHAWQAQLETGGTATANQTVTTAFDITEAGQRDCYYAQPDGLDDGMVTGNIDFSGTNKVTVFAAVRKLSDAATGILLELSSINTNPGTFAMAAPSLSGTNRYDLVSTGTTPIQIVTTSTAFNAPTTNILTGIGDISAPLAQLRVNGNVVASSSSSQGTGNYGNYPLFLFRRNAASNPFNGQCFGLIVAGGSYSLSTIQRIERILSRYTPGVSL